MRKGRKSSMKSKTSHKKRLDWIVDLAWKQFSENSTSGTGVIDAHIKM